MDGETEVKKGSGTERLEDGSLGQKKPIPEVVREDDFKK